MRTTASLEMVTTHSPLFTRLAYFATLTAVAVAILARADERERWGFGWVGGWLLLPLAAGAESTAWDRWAAALPALRPGGAALLRVGCALTTIAAWGALWWLTVRLGPSLRFMAVVACTLVAPLLVAHALYGALARVHRQRSAGSRLPGA